MHGLTVIKAISKVKEPKTQLHRICSQLQKDKILSVNEAVARVGGLKSSARHRFAELVKKGYVKVYHPAAYWVATKKLDKVQDVTKIKGK